MLGTVANHFTYIISFNAYNNYEIGTIYIYKHAKVLHISIKLTFSDFAISASDSLMLE